MSRSECRTIVKSIKTESTIQGTESEKFYYILSLGFFKISVASLEKVTFPGQKVLNMGYERQTRADGLNAPAIVRQSDKPAHKLDTSNPRIPSYAVRWQLMAPINLFSTRRGFHFPMERPGCFFGIRGNVGLLDWYTVPIALFCVLILTAHGATYLT
jgi:hypothetical protein